ncbi:hypothetical protein MKZ38_004600 [Zalerion maritima]|uniref:Uncharacterized protein n=1 Tax=Zalerion maritima TaxID=339359 RepID=A0AAD5RWI3_9PEZI|nr:hypothetical protein MKZ38_004600 [Zalerion maritima]
MYLLNLSDGYKFPGNPFVLEIVLTAFGLAAITDSGSLSIFDPQSLKSGPRQTISTGHSAIKLLRGFQAAECIVCTAAEDGKVCIWDLRLADHTPVAQLSDGPTGIQALTCSPASNTIAVGTDFENHQASVILWDIRSPSAPKTRYSNVHSDDITELKFHPFQPAHLLSGSTDGLVNILDTAVTDEDEVVVQTFNHNASIHRAGFLTDTEIFALSHDEKFALYSTAESVERGVATQDFGDMRTTLECQYVANVFPQPNGAGAIIGAGACEQEMFGLVHLSRGAGGVESWVLDKKNSVGLPGAHGQEVVRSFCFLDSQHLVLSGGEDGCVKAWSPAT